MIGFDDEGDAALVHVDRPLFEVHAQQLAPALADADQPVHGAQLHLVAPCLGQHLGDLRQGHVQPLQFKLAELLGGRQLLGGEIGQRYSHIVVGAVGADVQPLADLTVTQAGLAEVEGFDASLGELLAFAGRNVVDVRHRSNRRRLVRWSQPGHAVNVTVERLGEWSGAVCDTIASKVRVT